MPVARRIRRVTMGLPVLSSGGSPGSVLILYTDITAGPTTGGENNKGTYISVFGLGLGSFSDWGSSKKLMIGGVEVDNYRCLQNAAGQGSAGLGRGVYETWGIQRICAQVGALGSPSAGTALAIDIVDGFGASLLANTVVSGKAQDLDGSDITFTPQPGAIIFVAPAGSGGSDANAGTIAAPKLSLQTPASGGVFTINSSQNATDGIKPGTHVILRGGSHTVTGRNSRMVDLFRITGTAPTGGSDRGPIVVTAYPGAAGTNSPETASLDCAAGVGGCWNGNDTVRAGETSTSYGGFTGWCQYIHICNLTMVSSPTSDNDGGPVNFQNAAKNWRVINNNITWQNTVTGVNHPRAAGIVGNGNACAVHGNYVHDIFGDVSANENHGIYFDGGSDPTVNMRVSFNCIYNITGGNGIQFYDANSTGSTGNIVHHCWIEIYNKNGLNIADQTISGQFYNIVILDGGESPIRFNTSSVAAANGVDIWNITAYGWGRVASNRGAVQDDWSIGAGSVRIRNSIFMQTPSHAANSYSFANLNTPAKFTISNCRWYDPDGRLTTKPTEDSNGTVGTPSFVDAANRDFSLNTGSACIDAGASPATRSHGFSLNTAPQGAAHDIGAYERAP